MFQVYRVDKHDQGTNAYNVSREEWWEIVEDQSFDTERDARRYVVQMNQTRGRLTNWTDPWMSSERRAQVVEEFCFSDDSPMLKHRTYFLGKPPVEAIRDQLRADGIRVEPREKNTNMSR